MLQVFGFEENRIGMGWIEEQKERDEKRSIPLSAIHENHLAILRANDTR